MSGDSKDPNLESNEVDSIVQDNSLNETKKKEKRNFCQICEVQCTAKKNFEEHQKGRKHLKKLSEIKKAEAANGKRERPVIYKKGKKGKKEGKAKKEEANSLSSSNIPSNKEFVESLASNETDETMASHSNYYSSSSRNYNKSDRDNVKNKYNSFNNSRDYQSRNNNHYINYSNPYVYNNQGFYRNAQYSNFNNWNPMQYDRAPYQNAAFNGYVLNGNLYPQYRYNSQNVYPYPEERSFVCDSNKSANGSLSSQSCNQNNTAENENSSTDHTSEYHDNSETSERKLKEINSKNSENSEHLDLNSRKDDADSQQSVPSNIKQSLNSKTPSLESTSTSVADTVENNSSKQSSSPAPNISSKRKDKRLRSRSLSSSENYSNEKKLKEGAENQLADSDSVAEQQKIKKWTNTLLETNPGQISRLIHPSNYKDKAALNQLITNLAKSKRKENLTKLKSSSLGSNENLEGEESDVIEEEIEKIVESVISVSNNILDMPSTESNSDVEYNAEGRRKAKKSKKSSTSRNTESDVESVALNSSGKLKVRKKSQWSSPSNDSLTDSTKNSEKDKENCSATEESSVEKLRGSSNSEKSLKRKSLMTKNKSKKQKCSSAEDSEKVSDQNSAEADVTVTVADVVVNSPNIPKASETVDSSSVALPVKAEVPETQAQDPVDSAADINQLSQSSQLDLNVEFTADTLMQLFATGSVKVKNEFYDPVIDAIKSVDPNELINVCSSKASQNSADGTGSKVPSSELSVNTSKNKSSVSRPSTSKGLTNEDSNITSLTLGSIATSENISNVSDSNHSLSNSLSDNQNASSSHETDNATDSSLLYAKGMNLIPKDESHLSPQLRKLIEDLQEIALQEETVKQNITEAKNKISDYQLLLEEWKNKKKKLHDEEEDLRKKRNDIIKLMQEAVKPSTETEEKKNILQTEMETSHMSMQKANSRPVSDNQPSQKPVLSVRKGKSSSSSSSSKSSSKIPSTQGKSIDHSGTTETDEITILPPPVKVPVVIDLDDGDDVKVVQISSEDSDDIEGLFTNVITNSVPSMYDLKEITGHTATVNCLVVFEDYLYTCSNDSTAKRFNLKDPTQTVVYMHAAKNVQEIVVEKVQNEALVLTSCSNRVISLFIASSGTKIKSFFQTSAIMSICRGWGKFYCGMADGTINVYNWKYEEREFAKIEHPAARIATAHQGRLHFLVILSSNGNISLRDAETSLLIRCIKGFVKLPSWLTVYHDLAYLSSSDKTLTILDIMTGRAEKKMYLSCNTTGLGVFEDYIFTISYSGILNCYSKDRAADRKIFYGAGRTGLTCIHVYQDWVFSGNKKGDIAVFKFNPANALKCEFGTCSSVFGLKEDLEYHLEKDHVMKKKNLARCHWAICSFVFPPNWDAKDKMRHVIKHVYKSVISIA